MNRTNAIRRASEAKVALEYPWTETTEAIARFYTVDEAQGLTEQRVRQDLEKYGPNGWLICTDFDVDSPCRRRQTTLETHFRTIR